MVSSLIGHRHPRLGEILALWQALHEANARPAAGAFAGVSSELSAMILRLARAPNDDAWRIIGSGDAADAAYGAQLAGQLAARLSPGSEDADHEAEVTAETGRPLVIENDLPSWAGRRAWRGSICRSRQIATAGRCSAPSPLSSAENVRGRPARVSGASAGSGQPPLRDQMRL